MGVFAGRDLGAKNLSLLNASESINTASNRGFCRRSFTSGGSITPARASRKIVPHFKESARQHGVRPRSAILVLSHYNTAPPASRRKGNNRTKQQALTRSQIAKRNPMKEKTKITQRKPSQNNKDV